MSNAAAFAALEAHIDRVRSIPELAREAAPEVAVVFEAEILANVKRSVGPDGTPWAPTLDGHPPLQHTARELTVRAVGTSVVAQVTGIHARHHKGHVKGGKARPIIPTSTLPPAMAQSISSVLERRYLEHMGAGE